MAGEGWGVGGELVRSWWEMLHGLQGKVSGRIDHLFVAARGSVCDLIYDHQPKGRNGETEAQDDE